MPEDDPSPAPYPALLNRQSKWFKRLIYGIIVVAFALVFVLGIATNWLRSRKDSDQGRAISNLGQLYYALIGFDEEYGSFPNEETATRIREDFPTDIDLSGPSSNALFRQLFVAGKIDAEEIFYARIESIKKPDRNTSPGHLLEKGEVAFSYISGLSTKDDPTSPLLLTPLITGTTRFDPKPFKGKAVVLQIDKSVVVYEIQKDGHIYRDGIDLLSPKHPVWKGKTPDIRYPE